MTPGVEYSTTLGYYLLSLPKNWNGAIGLTKYQFYLHLHADPAILKINRGDLGKSAKKWESHLTDLKK